MVLAWLSGGELILIGVLGLLLFGGKLPDVAKDVGRVFFRLRRSMENIRRETGIDQTLRDLERETRTASHSFRDLQQATDRAVGPAAGQPPADILPEPGESEPKPGEKQDTSEQEGSSGAKKPA